MTTSIEFAEEISQLVHQYEDEGVPPEEMAAALELQLELVQSRQSH